MEKGDEDEVDNHQDERTNGGSDGKQANETDYSKVRPGSIEDLQVSNTRLGQIVI